MLQHHTPPSLAPERYHSSNYALLKYLLSNDISIEKKYERPYTYLYDRHNSFNVIVLFSFVPFLLLFTFCCCCCCFFYSPHFKVSLLTKVETVSFSDFLQRYKMHISTFYSKQTIQRAKK